MIRHVAFRMHLCATGNVHQLHRHRRGRLNGLTWIFHRISKCGPSPTPLLLLKMMTWHMCLIPPIWLLLKIATSRICTSTVRLVIFTTELHRNFSRIAETVAPLPTVNVMFVTVVRMTVARESLNRAYSVSHQRKLRRHKLKGPWGKQTRVYMKNLTKRHRVRKTSARRNARQVPKRHKTKTTNVCAQLLTHSKRTIKEEKKGKTDVQEREQKKGEWVTESQETHYCFQT